MSFEELAMKDLIPEILIYLKEHANDDQFIEQIAQHFGYSKYHFSRELKKLTGFSAKEYSSAIKMETSIEQLIGKDSTVLKSQLSSGFLSSGTFARNFKKNTGLSPKQYQLQLNRLFQVLKKYETQPSDQQAVTFSEPIDQKKYRCTIHLHYPENEQSCLTFIGLFHKPIPNHKPVMGQAIVNQNRVVFDRIPSGRFYILACAIKKSQNPLDYFILKNCLRGRIEDKVAFDDTYQEREFDLILRRPLPEDPPILFNFAQLLKEVLHKG